MGDPKKQKKKYRRPLIIWDEERIARDKDLIKDFGLKNKKEIWKVESRLKLLHNQAKKLIAQDTEQSKKEAEQLINKLASLNLIQPEAKLDSVLSLTINDLLNRRLQTVVFKKGLARTINQARQFITHNHIAINSQIINVPSYSVPSNEETSVDFIQYSTLASLEHPERFKEKEEAKILEKIKPKESKNLKDSKEKKIKIKEPKKEKKEISKKKEESKKEKEEGILEEAAREERKTHKEK